MMLLGLWFLLILLVSVMPVSGPKADLPADKIAHFVMYGLTSIFVFRIIANKTTGKRAFYLSVAIAALYGAVMEVVQYFLPYRSFSFGDMAANTFGAFLACILYMKWRRR